MAKHNRGPADPQDEGVRRLNGESAKEEGMVSLGAPYSSLKEEPQGMFRHKFPAARPAWNQSDRR